MTEGRGLRRGYLKRGGGLEAGRAGVVVTDREGGRERGSEERENNTVVAKLPDIPLSRSLALCCLPLKHLAQ